GEASGDLHASNLIHQLKALDTSADFRCWGGDLMEKQGAHLVKHYRDLAFMGFTEVLMNLRTILQNIEFCKKDVLQYQPDVLILVDYPGFNLRIAEFAKSKNIRVFYYISPQVWAWKQSRVHKIKQVVDKMFVILPFEKEFYKKFDYEVDFVGHPLLDAVAGYNTKPIEALSNNTKPIIALLPGSRKQEIDTMLPLMLTMQKYYPNHQFVIAGAPSQNEKLYQQYINYFAKQYPGNNSVRIVFNQTYQLLKQATAALVTSGTATLETALFGVPEVVCYKGGAISFAIAKKLVKVKYISLVNLIMDKEIVKELIQNDLNEVNLKTELDKLLGENSRKAMMSDYEELRKRLGGAGASKKTAELMISYLTTK
ncbi:MAG TPA: lipid-A-disaccharide synthase, partial [Bacteroidia bacterium]|nr:lipid-A-disaccharide synthase [Bacteroidia bacterium]